MNYGVAPNENRSKQVNSSSLLMGVENRLLRPQLRFKTQSPIGFVCYVGQEGRQAYLEEAERDTLGENEAT